jgi:hypothetical protein
MYNLNMDKADKSRAILYYKISKVRLGLPCKSLTAENA